MSGDWIKMRSNLWDDPRVSALVDATDTSEAQVVGGLYWLWATADQHSESGLLPGLTFRQIDRKTGISGFAAALAEIGWATESAGGVQLPRFDEHNGKTAKKRCQTAVRVARHKSGNAGSVTDALAVRDLEKEKEIDQKQEQDQKQARKRATPPPECPDDVDESTWADWLTLRKAKRAPVTATVLRQATAEADKAGLSLTRFLEIWCARGSQGLQADWLKPNELAQARAGPNGHQQSKTLTAMQKLQGMKHGNVDSKRDSGRADQAALPRP